MSRIIPATSLIVVLVLTGIGGATRLLKRRDYV